MEEDKLKDIFKDFNPDLSSDSDFISRLERSMKAVEIVKRQNAETHRRSKRAIVWAALAGFVAGIVMTILQPYIFKWLGGLDFTISIPSVTTVSIDPGLIVWIATAAISATIAYNTYEIASSQLSTRQQPA